MPGFFTSTTQTRQPLPLLPECGSCGLYKTCLSPKMKTDGDGQRKILICAEAPGSEEDQQGKPLVGPSGTLLQKTLAKFGIDMRRDCWLTNSIICRPPKNSLPPKSIGFCRPNIMGEIKRLNPEVIILLGTPAVKSVIGWLWKEDPGGITRWAGFKIPCQKPNAWIIPTYHPAALLYSQKENRNGQIDPILQMQFEEHLKTASETLGRPWKAVPDWKREIELVYSPDAVASILRKMIAKGGIVAFDFETDRLKPDHPDAEIVCCSVCWQGKKTIAFPWKGEAITAMRELVRSDLGKVIGNAKFEIRWCIAKLNTRIRNVIGDTMLDAHVLDNRKGITGLKFQVFARLGQESYDDHIKLFLKREGGNGKNQINKVNFRDLGLYCGFDSRLEWELWKVQQKDFEEQINDSTRD